LVLNITIHGYLLATYSIQVRLGKYLFAGRACAKMGLFTASDR